jgi:acetyl-CoA acetyltransferase
MRDVAVIGVGMTRFGKHPDKSIKDLVHGAVEAAIADAGICKSDLDAAYVGNAVAGMMTGQEMIRAQVTLTAMGIDKIPMYNVENACASSSTAFHLAQMAVAAGVYDCVLVVGFEKLFSEDKLKSFMALGSAVDVDMLQKIMQNPGDMGGILPPGAEKMFGEGSGQNRSVFMDMYAFYARHLMEKFGLTQTHFAKLAVKSHKNGALNPYAQHQKEVTLEQVLNSGEVSFPLTRFMCSPVGDGSAAAIVCSKEVAARFNKSNTVWVASSIITSGTLDSSNPQNGITVRSGPKAFEAAGVGPQDIDVIEVHDATAPSEIIDLIDLGIVKGEDACKWIDEGYLEIDGKVASNTSGGLQSKGHPIGATGLGQIHEIILQLRGEAGKRQVQGAKTGMTHNGGGILGTDAAAMALHIFKR